MKNRDNIKELFDKIELSSPSNDFHSRLMSECSKKVRKESVKELRIERAQSILATVIAFAILSWGAYMTLPKEYMNSVYESFLQLSMPNVKILKYQPETWGFAMLFVVLMAMIALCIYMTNSAEMSKLSKRLQKESQGN